MLESRSTLYCLELAERHSAFSTRKIQPTPPAKLWIIVSLQLISCTGCDVIPGSDLPPGNSSSQVVSDSAALSQIHVAERNGNNDNSSSSAMILPSRLLVKFKPGTGEDDLMRILGAAQTRIVGEIPELGIKIIELPEQASEVAQKQAFELEPRVEYVELDRVHTPADITPNDYWYFGQWHLARVGAPLAWSTTTGSSDVIIAICDTGVDATHPDLATKLVPGWNVYSNNADTSDATGHGTAVAGIAAAASNNSIGVASVAWGSNIMPIRIGSSSGATSSSIIATGIVWAANHGARVVNVSFGVLGSTVVSNAAQYLESRGGVMISSAGNDGLNFDFPNDPHVVTISATDAADVKAPFSNFGTFVDFAAPGAGIYSSARGGGYASCTGTSFAAPTVSGVAALVLSVNPELTASQVREILGQSCDDLGDPGWDTIYSAGRVNAGAAVTLATATLAPEVDTSAPIVNFIAPLAGDTVFGVVSVQISAEDNVGVISVELYVDGELFATDAAAPFDFTWDTSETANGLHSLEVQAMDAAGNASVQTFSVLVSNIGDSIAPTVVITWPFANAWVHRAIAVRVAAADNVGVARVELYVNGVIKDISTSSPFTTVWRVGTAGPGAYSLICKAFDAAGNMGQSSAVTVYRSGLSPPLVPHQSK
jgi:subtilisin family serine protease